MKLRWSEIAAGQIEDIYEFIARDKPNAARTTIEKLIKSIERLAANPYLGRSAEFGTRKLIHPPFVIVYRIVEGVISIEAVFHGSRQYN